ncbi:MAG TPA: DUF6710 family protein [Pyrinomonadaceae bacterium]
MGGEIIVVEVGASGRARRIGSLLSRLRNRVRGGRQAQREEFESIIGLAKNIAKTDPAALPALVKLIGRGAQARAMTGVLRRPDDKVFHYLPEKVLFDIFAPITADGHRLDDLKRKVPAPRAMTLGVDLVFPWPWARERIAGSLSLLRPGGRGGKWRQDPQNHFVELWLPLGVGWVTGGNHSLTAGIIHADGRVMPEVTFDISDVYRHVHCDGLYYRRTHDSSKISPVSDLEMAAIFEIGRLIAKHRVNF